MNRALFLPIALLAASAYSSTALAARDTDVTSFRAADAGDRLGHGGIVATSDPADSGLDSGLPIYERAVMDALGRIGYRVGEEQTAGGQVAEVAVTHAEVQPGDPPHRPVSGTMGTMISNRGSGFGLGLNIDLSKPRGPLVSTRLSVRIRDRATNEVLWEGRAETTARADKDGLDHGKVADRLVSAMFKGFPGAAQVVSAN
ncbi:MAG: DUF4136 domain-containing protein [Sphingomonadales bacterium]|nr:DUF4136 domain-containing protein [Sphingomonadales bacterium]MDE2567779.1 DUF4136 domain-containing protein [Sphingomonadales bacterium]